MLLNSGGTSVQVNDGVMMRGGVFGNHTFGSDRAFEQVRPVLALVVGGPRSRLILGTLETTRHVDGSGPDRTGPHGLLPPMQRETLAFERPWEAGLQWTIDTERLTYDSWVNWQRLNTRDQREVFDVGLSSDVRLLPALALQTDLHMVHEGGQLSNTGVVADSFSSAVGVEATGHAGVLDRVSIEGFGLFSRYVPDRGSPERSRTGSGTFLRASAEKAGWRLHGILWRSSDFIAREGDRNYLSLRRDGSEFREVREYVEAGLTRTFRPAPMAFIEVSGRWHPSEHRDEYSFRVLGVVRQRMPLKR